MVVVLVVVVSLVVVIALVVVVVLVVSIVLVAILVVVVVAIVVVVVLVVHRRRKHLKVVGASDKEIPGNPHAVYLIDAEPTFTVRAQNCPVYLGKHTYNILI